MRKKTDKTINDTASKTTAETPTEHPGVVNLNNDSPEHPGNLDVKANDPKERNCVEKLTGDSGTNKNGTPIISPREDPPEADGGRSPAGHRVAMKKGEKEMAITSGGTTALGEGENPLVGRGVPRRWPMKSEKYSAGALTRHATACNAILRLCYAVPAAATRAQPYHPVRLAKDNART